MCITIAIHQLNGPEEESAAVFGGKQPQRIEVEFFVPRIIGGIFFSFII
jgi:hypothetical protein